MMMVHQPQTNDNLLIQHDGVIAHQQAFCQTVHLSLSTNNSVDEVEAISALISLPSFCAISPKSTTASLTAQDDETQKTSHCFFRGPCPPILPSLTTHHRHSSSFSSTSTASSVDSSFYGNRDHEGPWYTGSTSLALRDDEDALSPLHCFMRKYCVEAFSATVEEVAIPRYGKAHCGKIVVGQVGIRCLHCKHLQHNRPDRAICYPSTLRNIYHSIETWQRRHAIICTEIPGWVRMEMKKLIQSSRSSAGGRRNYWEDAAKKLGMIDTPQGVRFARPPGLVEERGPYNHVLEPLVDCSSSLTSPVTTRPIVEPEDRELVSEYLYVLMNQMQVCHFTEEDRAGGRSKVKCYEVGYPGMQCKHCHGKAGLGRYFPSNADALGLANSDRNIYNHLLKCRKCPESIQLQLKAVRSEGSKNKRGSRKVFFDRVWSRIHEGCS